MKILHTYCLNYNIGDHALGIGLKSLLRENLDVDFIAETNIQGHHFTEYYIKEVLNKKYDLLIIGGGGIIHGSHWQNGWFWLIDINLIKEIKIPFIVYGIGYNYWDDEFIHEFGIKHLDETFNYSTYFSVRNDGSAKRLLDYTGINATVIPDPGFHVNLYTNYNRPFNCPYVIIQIANDKPEKRFKTKLLQEKFIYNLRIVIKELSLKYKVILAPHVYEDISISNEIVKHIENAEVWNFSQFAFDKCSEAIGYYKYADFVISMRGHGVIIPFSFNTPVISLENHPKHSGLMTEFNLKEFNINIYDEDFLDKLLSKIKLLISKRKYLVKMYKKINLKLNKSTQLAFLEIKDKLHKSK